MKPKHIRRNLALVTTVFTCGVAAPAMSQSLFDVYLLSDTTGSMGGLINGVRLSSNAIVDSFSATGNDVVFGVGEFKDSFADSFGFRHNLKNGSDLPILSADHSLIEAAITQWSASGGGDFPEDNLFALRTVANTSPWRDTSRRIVYIFGDAPSLVTSSDGTTIDDTLAALAANCVEVVFVDVGGMTSGSGQSQIDAILANELDCGHDPGDYLELDIAGLSAEEAAARVLETLSGSFDDITGGGNTLILSTIQRSTVSSALTATAPVSHRLVGIRNGLTPASTDIQAPAPPAQDAKGGMSAKAPAYEASSSPKLWEVYGVLFYAEQDADAQTGLLPTGAPFVLFPGTDTETLGGTVGIDRRLTPEWLLGFAFSASNSDVSVGGGGPNADIDAYYLTPYVSYVREDVFAGADYYFDTLYSYGSQDYDINNAGAIGSPEGNTHTVEANTGLKFKSGNVKHGPFVGLRWLTGDIDAYTAVPGGAVPGTDFDSFVSRLGYEVATMVPISGGTLMPYANIAWEHEFEDESVLVGGVPVSIVDEDTLVLGVGIATHLMNGWTFQTEYEGRLGDDVTQHYVGLRVGYQF